MCLKNKNKNKENKNEGKWMSHYYLCSLGQAIT